MLGCKVCLRLYFNVSNGVYHSYIFFVISTQHICCNLLHLGWTGFIPFPDIVLYLNAALALLQTLPKHLVIFSRRVYLSRLCSALCCKILHFSFQFSSVNTTFLCVVALLLVRCFVNNSSCGPRRSDLRSGQCESSSVVVGLLQRSGRQRQTDGHHQRQTEEWHTGVRLACVSVLLPFSVTHTHDSRDGRKRPTASSLPLLGVVLKPV